MNKKKRSLLKNKIQHNFHLLQENFTLFLFLMSKTKLQYKENDEFDEPYNYSHFLHRIYI